MPTALPVPHLNEWIELSGRRYRVDCRWPGTREIVELDGWDAHGTRSAFRADRERDRRLRRAGYGLTRITWAQLEEEPEAIAADLRALLDRAGPGEKRHGRGPEGAPRYRQTSPSDIQTSVITYAR